MKMSPEILEVRCHDRPCRKRAGRCAFPLPVQRQDVETQRVRMAESVQDATADRFKGDGADSDAAKSRLSREEVALRVRSLSERADDIQRARAQVSLARGDLREIGQGAAQTLAAEDARGAAVALDRVAEVGDALRQAMSLLVFAAAGIGLNVGLEDVPEDAEGANVPSGQARGVAEDFQNVSVSVADRAAERAAAALTRALRGGGAEEGQVVPEPTPADASAGIGEDYFPYGLPVQSGEAFPPKTEADLGEVVTSVLQGADVGVRYGRAPCPLSRGSGRKSMRGGPLIPWMRHLLFLVRLSPRLMGEMSLRLTKTVTLTGCGLTSVPSRAVALSF